MYVNSMPDPAASSLVVLGCSATKFDVEGTVPAVHLYDGPMYRVLRTHLRSYRWPTDLSVSVLSAKYGLIGGLAPIGNYERRMTPQRALQLREKVTSTLKEISARHKNLHVILGKDYLQAINAPALGNKVSIDYAEGPIGMKLHRFSALLSQRKREPRTRYSPELGQRPLYFLPDWDDFLDVDYDFDTDAFSAKSRAERNEVHMIKLFQPQRLCDGVLVSLAQNLGTKGLLRRVPLDDPYMLKPRSVRDHFGLADDQWAFGDCGAFSYVNEAEPAISVEQAVAVYELHEFDLGASVDHIPLEEIFVNGKKQKLSRKERERRVRLTKKNAEAFINLWKARKCSFAPVGVIQGIKAEDYGVQINEYIEMGYEHIALGGLVPRSDDDIAQVVASVADALKSEKRRPWIHLLGVFRPKIQAQFREAGINSFDSATYFRKAWLRSDQNYLGIDGKWYAAIRVPPTHDARTLLRLKESGKRKLTIERREKQALDALRSFANGKISEDDCLDAVLSYDKLLNRGDLSGKYLRAQYRNTLHNQPWKKCKCSVCRDIGINVVVFRGCNRNKRRGAHNTCRLYEQLSK
jgi:Queuine tRNA-ribosyltransferase